MSYYEDTPLSDMLGATLIDVEGCEKNSEAVVFRAEDGRVWHMWHEQDCCESVSVDDVTGNVSDLIGSPLTMSEEVSNEPEPPASEYAESFTWTFYKFATVKGYVTLRWYGESNGYYSESVTFRANA
jgi:hypothetical protein